MCRYFHWHNFLQRLDVAVKFSILVVFLCLTQFFTDISAQVLIRCFYLSAYRIFETVAVLDDFFLHLPDTCTKLFSDVRYIHTAEFEDTCNDTVLDIGRGGFFLFFNDTFSEYIGLVKFLYPISFFICRFFKLFKGKYIGIVYIIAEKRNGGVLVEVSVCADKIIVCLVEFVKQGFQPLIAFILGLIGKDFCKGFLDSGVRLETFHFRMPLYLISIYFEELCACCRVDVQLSVFDKHFANLLAGHCISDNFCVTLAKFLRTERADKFSQHFFLLLILFRV